MNCGEKDSPMRLNLKDDELVARLPSRLKMMGLGNLESSKEASSSGKRGCGRSSGVAGVTDGSGLTGGSGGHKTIAGVE
jgi:hypothetical protein